MWTFVICWVLCVGELVTIVNTVGQCDLDLGSSHYIRADTGLPRTLRLLRCKHPDQPDMLDAINYATK